jgi:hypothetical protein
MGRNMVGFEFDRPLERALGGHQKVMRQFLFTSIAHKPCLSPFKE